MQLARIVLFTPPLIRNDASRQQTHSQASFQNRKGHPSHRICPSEPKEPVNVFPVD
jgi:hypothetical protein